MKTCHDRRALLRTSALSVMVGLAGCFSLDPGTQPATTETATSTSRPPDERQDGYRGLELDAAVLNQQSSNKPATLLTEVRNTSAKTITVETVPTIFFVSDRGLDEGIVLYPDEDIGPNRTPTRSQNGCWRYTDEHLLVRDEIVVVDIPPRGLISERHSVYTAGQTGECLPNGKYALREQIEIRSDNEPIHLVLDLAIDNGDITVSSTRIETVDV